MTDKKKAAADLREIGDTIFVNDFIVDCNVGVYAEEQGVTQKVRFTVEARLAKDIFSIDDEMVEVPSYADIIDAIVALARGGHINLVETFAERIAAFCLSDVPRVRPARGTRVAKRDQKLRPKKLRTKKHQPETIRLPF